MEPYGFHVHRVPGQTPRLINYKGLYSYRALARGEGARGARITMHGKL